MSSIVTFTSLAAAETVQSTVLTGPATNETAQSFLRAAVPVEAFSGPAWDLLLGVLGTSEQKVWDLAGTIEEQLFLATALEKYLDRQGSKVGVPRPNGVGMSDEHYRNLVTAVATEQVTPKALMNVLEAFFGMGATHAHLTTTRSEPYIVEDNTDLLVRLDGKDVIKVQFRSSDFSGSPIGTAQEVAETINHAMRAAGATAVALAEEQGDGSGAPAVTLYSGSLGLDSKIEIVGGTAQFWLRFPTWIAQSVTGDVWSLTQGNLRTRYTQVGAGPTWQQSVRVGDYVLVRNNQFIASNQGSFEVVDVGWTMAGGQSQWFEVENVLGQSQSVTLASDGEICFFRPTTASLQNGVSAYLKQDRNEIRVVMPPSTAVVERSITEAAYLMPTSSVSIASASASAAGLVTVVTSSGHGIVAGQAIQVSGLSADTAGGLPVSPNGLFWALSGSGTTLTYQLVLPYGYVPPGIPTFTYTTTGATVEVVRATASTRPGPTVFDPIAGPSLTSTSTTTSAAIEAGKKISVLDVADASGFPNSSAWTLVGMGHDYATVAPIIGRTAGMLLMDPRFTWPRDIPSGAAVNLLTGRAPLSATPEGAGAFLVTGSATGRVAAQEAVKKVAMAGPNLSMEVKYPSDVGLGNAGLPTIGARVTDLVSIYGGSQLDQELEIARMS